MLPNSVATFFLKKVATAASWHVFFHVRHLGYSLGNQQLTDMELVRTNKMIVSGSLITTVFHLPESSSKHAFTATIWPGLWGKRTV